LWRWLRRNVDFFAVVAATPQIMQQDTDAGILVLPKLVIASAARRTQQFASLWICVSMQ